MIEYVDVYNFMQWFVGQVTNIASGIFSNLDSITWSGFSLLDFMIAITIISIFLSIIINSARSNGNRIANATERKHK